MLKTQLANCNAVEIFSQFLIFTFYKKGKENCRIFFLTVWGIAEMIVTFFFILLLLRKISEVKSFWVGFFFIVKIRIEIQLLYFREGRDAWLRYEKAY